MGSPMEYFGLFHSIESARAVFDRLSPEPDYFAYIEYMDIEGCFHSYESRNLDKVHNEVYINP
jgi:hypothetical protein